MKHSHDEISLSVLWRGFGNYRLDMLRADVFAALGVALLSVPLSMAYALAAGLPPIVGVFATIFGAIFAAAFGSSRHLVVGPTNTIAILIQAGIAEILYTYYRDVGPVERSNLALNIMIQLTLVVGILQLLAGVFKLGRLTQFVSRSVVIGYVVGAALAIVVSQFYYFVGMSTQEHPSGIYEKLEYLVLHIQQAHLPTVLLGLGSIIFLLLGSRLSKRIPVAVIMLAIASSAVLLVNSIDSTNSFAHVVLVKDFGEIDSIFPTISMPFFDARIMNTLLPIAFAIALLGILEATTIAKTIAAHTGQVLSMNQEILAMGVSNILVSCLGSMPCSGSFARSSLNYSFGAKTRIAAVLSGVFVGAIFYVFQPIVANIPLSALAAILLVSAVRMINVSELKLCIKATASDCVVLVVTVLACVLFNLEIAFYMGVILSIVLYLKKASTPRFVECAVDKSGELSVLIASEPSVNKEIRVLQVEGELFFAAADLLQTTVKSIAEDAHVKVVVLHMTNAYHVDATACVVLQHLYDYLHRTGRHLVASGISRQVWQVFCDSGLASKLGSENLFFYEEKHPAHATQKAMLWAEALSRLHGEDESLNQDLVPSTGSHFKVVPSKGTLS
ncbi:MAG: SulP family inorganic anion transporter [Chlamydiales bacterium]|nr:SulP family inorganic anion transporter [Chlamydiales bacterium]